jgi:Rrf2 family protein
LSPFPRADLIAITLVIDIAIHGRGGRVPAIQIAARQKLPRRHFEALLQALTRNDILTSTPGRKGGYNLARHPGLISADDVLRAVQDTEEVSKNLKMHSPIGKNVIMPALRQAEKALSEALQCITIQQLVRSAEKL